MSGWCATRSTAIGASDSDTPTCGVRPLSSRVRRSASITRSKTPTSSRSCCEKADGRRPASGSPGEEELDHRARDGERRPEDRNRGQPVVARWEQAVEAKEEKGREPPEGTQGGEPNHGGREQPTLLALPKCVRAKQEDERERGDPQENGHRRDRADQPDHRPRADQRPRESIGVSGHDGRPHARWCILFRSPSNGFKLGGMSTPGSSTLSERPWSRFRFQTSALKASSPSVKSAREAGMPSRGIGKRSAWTLPPYMDRQILSVENGVTGARRRRRSRRHAWSVHRAPVSPSYARPFTIST